MNKPIRYFYPFDYEVEHRRPLAGRVNGSARCPICLNRQAATHDRYSGKWSLDCPDCDHLATFPFDGIGNWPYSTPKSRADSETSNLTDWDGFTVEPPPPFTQIDKALVKEMTRWREDQGAVTAVIDYHLCLVSYVHKKIWFSSVLWPVYSELETGIVQLIRRLISTDLQPN